MTTDRPEIRLIPEGARGRPEAPDALRLTVLGEPALWRGGRPVALPPSKKTRALLCYLAVTGTPHRRERLCSLFWDVTDDPKGALRWSLSKLRALVDGENAARIVADRESVRFEARGAIVDWCALRERIALGLDGAHPAELGELAAAFRGDFLEGLELPDFDDFQAWCVAEREAARKAHAEVLRALVERLEGDSAASLPHLRTLVRIEPFDAAARAQLIRALATTGHVAEMELYVEASQKLFAELGRPEDVERVRAAVARPDGVVVHESVSRAATPALVEPEPPSRIGLLPMAGRQAERARLAACLERVEAAHRAEVLLVLGEPGIGKTRLLEELRTLARAHGAVMLEGRSYEAELTRPYGPWIDALRRLPGHVLGDVLGAELSPLLPELGETARATSRDRLFGAVSDLVSARAHGSLVLVVLDDLQWCDPASAELLHYVARMNQHRRVLFALAARDGELADNPSIDRVLRALRRTQRLEELFLSPLDPAATAELLRAVGSNADADRVHAASAGNPLYALELSCVPNDGGTMLSRSLRELVRDRVARLPLEAAEVLRWCAVSGATVPVRHLARVCGLSPEALVGALETLERHGMLRQAEKGPRAGEAYEFAHDVVRQAVYAELSEPRRKLMHLRLAEMLAEHEADDESAVSDLVRHAAIAGDPERATDACVRAGRRCLRLFANREAATLARRGLRLVEQLPRVERVRRTLELHEIDLAACRPDDLQSTAAALEALAEEALDLGCPEHARLGYHLASYLRWEQGDFTHAQRAMLQAERVSRGANEAERTLALAEAARCLTLLGRDLPHAEALLLEANARAARAGIESVAIPDAVGMLRLHQGSWDEAARLFEEARAIARRNGDRDGEFRSLEHRLMVELERDALGAADTLARELLRLGERLREGSELPFARVLSALVALGLGDDSSDEALTAALDALRDADAKHRLVYALTRAAEIDNRRGRSAQAGARAEEALGIAERLGQKSELVLALRQAVRAALATGEKTRARDLLQRTRPFSPEDLSERARRALHDLQVAAKELETRADSPS
ncbi:MAG: AAA family ATPase [Pseudomonadota bacterium]